MRTSPPSPATAMRAASGLMASARMLPVLRLELADQRGVVGDAHGARTIQHIEDTGTRSCPPTSTQSFLG